VDKDGRKPLCSAGESESNSRALFSTARTSSNRLCATNKLAGPSSANRSIS
jgi:hypothetical protein